MWGRPIRRAMVKGPCLFFHLGLAIGLGLALFISQQQASAFWTVGDNDHADITRAAQREFPDYPEWIWDIIIAANTATDDNSNYLFFEHFDRPVMIYSEEDRPVMISSEKVFILGRDLIQRRKTQVAIEIKGCHLKTAAQELGKALHTLQDFFAHSNFVELNPSQQQILFESLFNLNSNLPSEFRCCTYDPYINGGSKWNPFHNLKNASGQPIKDPEAINGESYYHGFYGIGGYAKDFGQLNDVAQQWAVQASVRLLREIPPFPKKCDDDDDDGGGDRDPRGPGLPVDPTRPWDPNEIFGPTGVGTHQYITSEVPLQYTISFENLETATASAQEVVITDQLDPDKVDLDTFRLGPIEFGDHQVVPREGQQEYLGFVDLRPATNLVVRVEAQLEEATGLVTWRFVSLDPNTAELTEDPLLGFLPPNQDGTEGQGSVQFSVMPRKDLPSGTVISNQAQIIFDVNPPVDTNVWTNTIDSAAATSRVADLPQVVNSGKFRVTWEGTDEENGSGLQDYTVYVSDNGGPFVPWLQRTTQTSAVYTGKFGHTYRFYTVAQDHVGNREAKTTPDTQTQVGQAPTLPAGLQMVNVPVESEQADPQKVFGFEGNKWARYDPTANNGQGAYVYYDNDPQGFTRFSEATKVPGRSYWTKLTRSTTPAVVGPLPDDTKPFSIPLKKGWNMIGNPWLLPVVWDLAQWQVRVGGTTKPLQEAGEAVCPVAWQWQGKYQLLSDASVIPGVPNTLEPWTGCWVLARKDCELLVPPPSQARRSREEEKNSKPEGWTLWLKAQTSDGVAEALLGETAGGRAVSAGPPPDPPEQDQPVRLVSLHEGQPLTIDLRPGRSGRQVWEIMVEHSNRSQEPLETSDPSEVTLTWPDLRRVPKEVSLTLVDPATGTRRFLHTTTHYTYRPSRQENRRCFQIVAERGHRSPLQITDLQIEPMRGLGLRLTFTLNRAAQTTVRVCSLSGRQVSLVEQGQSRAAGLNTTTWDGRDLQGRPLPAGVYLLTLQATDEEGRQVQAVKTVRVN